MTAIQLGRSSDRLAASDLSDLIVSAPRNLDRVTTLLADSLTDLWPTPSPPLPVTNDPNALSKSVQQFLAVHFALDRTLKVSPRNAAIIPILADDEGVPSVWRLTCDYVSQDELPRAIESSTQLLDLEGSIRHQLAREAEGIFQQATEESFADGFESDFSQALTSFVLYHGTGAVDAVRDVLHGPSVSVEVWEESLRQLGYIEDAWTHEGRLALLIEALRSDVLRIRDAASIGIASLDDPLAIPHLQAAIAREPSAWLRESLVEVVAQLEDAA